MEGMEGMVSPEFVREHVEQTERPTILPPGRGGKRPGAGRKKGTIVSKVARAEQDAMIAGMFSDNQTLAEISKRVNLSPSSISERIDAFVAKLETQALESVSRRISRSEAVYRSVQILAHLGYLRSMRDRKVVTNKTVKDLKALTAKKGKGRAEMKRKNVPRAQVIEALDDVFGPEGLPDEEEIDEEALFHPEMIPMEMSEEVGQRIETGRPGDPAFLRVIMDCQKEIDELRGNKPKRDGEGNLFGFDSEEIRRLPVEERAARLRTVREKLQLKMAQRLSLGEGEATFKVIEATPVRQAAPFARQPMPVAPTVAQSEEEEPWLL